MSMTMYPQIVHPARAQEATGCHNVVALRQQNIHPPCTVAALVSLEEDLLD